MLAQTIAHYRIQAKIGAGGMGEVYRATDTRLHRDVAIKVLPEALARDTGRMAGGINSAPVRKPNLRTEKRRRDADATGRRFGARDGDRGERRKASPKRSATDEG